MKISMRKTSFPLLVGAFLLPAWAGIISLFQLGEVNQIGNDHITLSHQNRLAIEVEQRQRLKMIGKAPSLGFRNMVADGVFLSFLQYFSNDSVQANTAETLSPDFFEAIIGLDPFYRDYYLFLSSSTTLYAAQPQKTVKIMEKGLKAIEPNILSDSFYIWRYKAVDELLFLGNSQLAQKSFEKAAEWARYSDDPESKVMGEASHQTASFLATDPDSRPAQIAAWSSVLSSALNDDIRKKAVQHINELGGVVHFQKDGSIKVEATEVDSSDQIEKSNG